VINVNIPITVIVFALLLLVRGVKVLQEYERAVVFRLGRLVPSRGPGLIYIIPLIERMVRVSLRTITFDVPPQDVITHDNVSLKVSAVLYFRVLDPSKALVEVAQYLFATSQLTPQSR
jgi:regulator of protease activity HflC (stomatin/prohibitin superfamily)